MAKKESGTTQVYNPQNNRYVKRDKQTGQFVDMNEKENEKFANTPIEIKQKNTLLRVFLIFNSFQL